MSTPEKLTDDPLWQRFGHSIWVRPLRLLCEHGTPPSDTTILSVGHPEKGPLPFGAISRTLKGQLIFWPVLPQKRKANYGGGPGDIDHVTLHLATRKAHITWFDEAGQREHYSESWRAIEIPDTGLALWFRFFVQWRLLFERDPIIEFPLKTPAGDEDRRTNEFKRFVTSLRAEQLPLPPLDGGNFVLLNVFLASRSLPEITWQKDAILAGGVDGVVEGWPDGTFNVQPSNLALGDLEIAFAACCPPGSLRDAISIGLPRRPKKA